MSANGSSASTEHSIINSSSTQDESNDRILRYQSSSLDRAVTDAVHERFIPNYVYCETCKEKFLGNGVSIHKHFKKSHQADAKCIYCHGKVFYYYKVKNDDNKAERFDYHKCRDWESK